MMLKFIKNTSLFLLSAFFVGIFIECYFEFAGIKSNPDTVIDSIIGYRNIPNTSFLIYNEGFRIGNVNKSGYLGKNHNQKNPDSTVRIVLLGDSFVEGLQVFDRHHFRYLLEKELSNSLNCNVEVLNFGKSGVNLNRMYCYYEDFAKKFQPDYLLLFLSNEDLIENSKTFKEENLYPYCELVDSSLHIKYNFRKLNKYKTYNNYNALINTSYGKLLNSAYALRGQVQKILFDKFYCKVKNSTVEKEKSITPISEAILNELSKNTKLIIVLREQFLEKIINKLRQREFEIINMDSLLVQHEEKTGISLKFWKATNKTGHWNQQGHQQIATILRHYFETTLNESIP